MNNVTILILGIWACAALATAFSGQEKTAENAFGSAFLATLFIGVGYFVLKLYG